MVKRRKGSKSGKACWKQVKGIGRRCVTVLSSGKWRFRKNSACGGRKVRRRSKK